MKLIPILLISILLIGCSKEALVCENVTIETIKYINRNITITEKCNITNNTIKYTYTGTTSRELELIRRLSFCEGQQDKFINHSDCFDELNESNNELKDCEDEMCKDNSSWC